MNRQQRRKDPRGNTRQKIKAKGKFESNYATSLATPPVRKIFTFVKFNDRKWLEELRKGNLFMRPLTYFQKLEASGDSERPDKAEGASLLLQAEKIRVILGTKDKKMEMPGLTDQLMIHFTQIGGNPAPNHFFKKVMSKKCMHG